MDDTPEWIHLDDAVEAITPLFFNDDVEDEDAEWGAARHQARVVHAHCKRLGDVERGDSA